MGTRSRLLTALLALALAGALALVTPTATAKPKKTPDPSKGSVTLKAPSVALVGSPIVFTGVVKPKRARLGVQLQRKVGSGWKVVANARTKAGGRYRVAGTVDFGGIDKFRVVRTPWLTTSVHTRTATVAAYVWNDVNHMVDVDDFDKNAVTFGRDIDMAGARYRDSIVIDADSQGDSQGGWFEVDMTGLRCAALDVTAGGLDGNDPSSEVGLRVSLDGKQVAGGTYQRGQTERLVLDVRGADRLRVEGLVVKEGLNGDLGLGTPRLLCAS